MVSLTDLALHERQSARHCLCARLVIPEVRRGRLLLELNNFLREFRYVENRLNVRQRRCQLIELLLNFNDGTRTELRSLAAPAGIQRSGDVAAASVATSTVGSIPKCWANGNTTFDRTCRLTADQYIGNQSVQSTECGDH